MLRVLDHHIEQQTGAMPDRAAALYSHYYENIFNFMTFSLHYYIRFGPNNNKLYLPPIQLKGYWYFAASSTPSTMLDLALVDYNLHSV